MKNFGLAKENIKEALFGKYTECKDDELLYGPMNGFCKVCGKPIRSSEGYVCCNCGWEFDIFVENTNEDSVANFNLTANEYKELYKNTKKELFKGVD